METNVDLILEDITQKNKEIIAKLQEVKILLTEIIADMNTIANHNHIDFFALMFVIQYLHKFFSVINPLIAVLNSLNNIKLQTNIISKVKNLGKTHLL